ncbi:MAG: ankyrin repeat domain-containing protein [Myxococcota bacterium]
MNDDSRRPEKRDDHGTSGKREKEDPLKLSESEKDFEEWWWACCEGEETLIGAILNDLDPGTRTFLINRQMDASHSSLTCLMMAAISGYTHVARYLLQYGADITLKSTEGKTALDYAVEKGRNEITQAILVRIIATSS